ncbi:MAG: hypothetical protein U5K69_02565 [Balneolaceae bacterium]|nr:hypothetical protein [Balneolaceae bacterium]
MASFCTYLKERGYTVSQPERKNEKGVLYETSDEMQQVLLNIMNNDHVNSPALRVIR